MEVRLLHGGMGGWKTTRGHMGYKRQTTSAVERHERGFGICRIMQEGT